MYGLLTGGYEVSVPKSKRLVFPKEFRDKRGIEWGMRELDDGLIHLVPIPEGESIDDFVGFTPVEFAEKGRIKRIIRSNLRKGDNYAHGSTVYVAGAGESVVIDTLGKESFLYAISKHVPDAEAKRERMVAELKGESGLGTAPNGEYERRINHHGRFCLPQEIKDRMAGDELYVNREDWYEDDGVVEVDLFKPGAVGRYMKKVLAEGRSHADPHVEVGEVLEAANLAHGLQVAKINKDRNRTHFGLPREGYLGCPITIRDRENYVNLLVGKDVLEDVA